MSEGNGRAFKFTFQSKKPDVDIEIDGKAYTVREMSDTDLTEWMERRSKVVTVNVKTGTIRKYNYAGLHAELISRCLFDEKGHRVPKILIEGWGSSIKNRLFDLCNEHNGFDEKTEEEEEKNSGTGGGTTGGTESSPEPAAGV